MNIAIASDHSGIYLRAIVIEHLRGQGHTVTDFGSMTDESVDYPDYAEMVARSVARGQADNGVLICGTGIGMAIAANKIKSIRAASATTAAFAALAREHNDANVLTLSGRFVDTATNITIIDTFLATPFGAGRHLHRVEKIAKLEGAGTEN